MTKIKSFTVGLPVTELKRAVEWYRQLLGEAEEVNPAPGVWEFQVVPSGWLQLFESEINDPNQSVMRFESDDIEASRMLASSLSINVGQIETVPEAVRYFEFGDPFGNRLSFYELLVEKLGIEVRGMMFAIKAEISNLRAETFAFSAQKTMYGGKQIAEGDTIYVFASENEGGPGLVASGVVTSAKAIAKKRGIARQTPRVSITVRRTARAKRRLGRSELRLFSDWNDGRPETELNFKFYRQATNKIVGISDEAAAFLREFF